MTGLDLETLLLPFRADLGAWLVFGLAAVGVALLVWSCRGSRRALRRCLVLSLAAHLGLVLYGSTVPAVRKAIRGGTPDPASGPHIRHIRVDPVVEPSRGAGLPAGRAGTGRSSSGPGLLLAATNPVLANPALRVPRPAATAGIAPASPTRPLSDRPVALASATPRLLPGVGGAPELAPRREADASSSGTAPEPPRPVAPDLAEVVPPSLPDPSPSAPGQDGQPSAAGDVAAGRPIAAADRSLRADVRIRPARPGDSRRPGASVRAPGASGGPSDGLAAAKAAGGSSGGATGGSSSGAGMMSPGATSGPLALDHVEPPSRPSPGGPGLSPLAERPPVRTPADVPRVYRPRLEPDRPDRARLAGASEASERAVERALDWLARHQDDDGRWNAALAHFDNGLPVGGDTGFTSHCPPGDICTGECAYWEADTALTGLALLAYLGAGHTHLQGRHAETVRKGLDFLIGQQKADGDLRGDSVVVGMYCHAMATLALCEGYALSADPRLRDPATRAIAFLVRSRARDGMAWRYKPGEAIGDTSILGWVVMCLKSARETGIPIPQESSVRSGALAWLDRVALGSARGLACYQPGEARTPTMTAEAWVCRQFLDVGGPGPASDEAALYLVERESDRGKANYYYWYYATLALFQHGGEPWSRWNGAMRDRIVALQHADGHRAGSWSPDDSLYGKRGGRIYCTALGALTLEVYYRYLRLYDNAGSPAESGGGPELAAPRGDPPAAALRPEDR